MTAFPLQKKGNMRWNANNLPNISRLPGYIFLEHYYQNAFSDTTNDSIQLFKPLVHHTAGFP
jgi:hypothetical protein